MKLLNLLLLIVFFAPPVPKEALFYKKLKNKKVQCLLCPRQCIIPEGKRGYCRSRKNENGKLYSLSYGKIAAIHIDPIEKKPFYHFLPGNVALSIATPGCNLRCTFCQNWTISQYAPDEIRTEYMTPERIVDIARINGCAAIAYTYSEPTIFYEYMIDCARLAHKYNIKNLMVTCGYINPEPFKELLKYLDAVVIDLKGFSDEVYRKIGYADFKAIKQNLRIARDSEVWFEITYLVIPGYNDSDEELTNFVRFVSDSLGKDIPVHFLRFFPRFKLTRLPPTPVATLRKAHNIAKKHGLKYVYIGNVPDARQNNTYCPRCGHLLIERKGFFTIKNMIKNGHCPYCGEKIPGVFE